MLKFNFIISFLSKKEKRHLFGVFICMVLVGFLEIVGVGSISPFISVVSNPEIIYTNNNLKYIFELFNFKDVSGFIIFLGVVVIVFLTISNLARTGISFLTRYFAGRRLHTISVRLMEKYIYQPYVFFLNKNTSDISKNILGEVSNYVNGVLVTMLQLFTNVIITGSILIFLFIINPLVAVISIGILGFLYITIFFGARVFLHKKGKERAEAQSMKYKYVSEAFNGIKDVKLLNREKIFVDQFSVPSRKFAINNAISDVVGDAPRYIIETIAFSGIVAILLVQLSAGKDVGGLLPTLTVFAFGGFRMLPALNKIFNAVAKMKYNFPVVEILHKDYREIPDGEKPANGAGITPIGLNKNLDLKNIVFKYPNTSEPVIRNQGLKIKANTSIGFIGPTGCGKTTLVDIILGLLDAESGEMFVDDIKIDGDNKRSWQANLGYVPQSIYLTDDSIKKNIAFGIPEDDIDMEAVKKAAGIANLESFIENDLKDKYDTVVGERGVRLSGGQRQRIGIARAVYHDPSVLIMDEATSALDGLTENAIMDAINNLSHKKTIIMIAHRLTTVKECDVIYIMDKGVIVDQGEYNELLERNDQFRMMAEGN